MYIFYYADIASGATITTSAVFVIVYTPRRRLTNTGPDPHPTGQGDPRPRGRRHSDHRLTSGSVPAVAAGPPAPVGTAPPRAAFSPADMGQTWTDAI
jgi:hypothetical protein